MTNRLVRYSVAVMMTLLALAILWQFRIAVVYVFISVTLAATFRPLVTRLAGKGILARAGWILIYLLAIGGVGLLLYLIGKVAFVELQQLAGIVSAQDKWNLPVWLQGTMFQQVLVARLLPPSKFFQVMTYDQGQSILPAILGFTQSIAGVISGAGVIILLSIYWIINKDHFERLWLSLLPSGQRKNARDTWHTIEPDLGAYLRSQIIHSLMIGLLIGVGYWIIGSPYPVVLALLSGILSAIPFIGVVLIVILPLVVGVLAGTPLTLVMSVYTIIILIVLGTWIRPKIFYRRWDNPILALVVLIALANAFGLLGIALAPPLAAICQILWSLFITQRLSYGEVATNTDFKQRQERIWATIREMDEPFPPQVISTMDRLGSLIEKAESVLQLNQNTISDSSELQLEHPHQPDQE